MSSIGKIVGVGLNYSDHAAASVLKSRFFPQGHQFGVRPLRCDRVPRGSNETDWEVELSIVIGRPAKYVDETNAMAHVAGFCPVNDVSEREF